MKVKKSKIVFWALMIAFQIFFLRTELFAGDTGKISGKIVDAATGEALAGANIGVRGTSLGAAADVDGDFYILNIPPGTYSLEASMIGYKTEIKTEVRVSVDRSIRVDFELSTAILEGETVTVIAEREIVRKDVSSTQINLTGVEIQSQPLTSTTEILTLLPGITASQSALGGSGISIRGGGIDETDFQLDEISLRDQLTDVSFLTVPKSSIAEIQILSGGFSAEYGRVRSGLVNVIMKDGSYSEYSGAVEVRYSPPTRKHFGPNAFDQNGRIWQVYAGPQAFEGTTTEDVELFRETNGKQGYPFTFRGWNAIVDDYLNDGNPNNDITPQNALEIWKWRHRVIDYANEPDYNIDASVSGPLPFTGNKVSFLAAFRHETVQYPYPLSRNSSQDNIFYLKLTSQLTPSLKLTIGNIYGKKEGASIGFADDIGAISGSYWGPVAATASGSREAIEFAAGNFTYNSMYAQGYRSLRDDTIYRLNLKLNYVFSPSTFSEFRYQYGKNWVDAGHMGARDTTGIHRIGNIYYDETPRGWETALTSNDQTGTFIMTGGGERLNESTNYNHSLDWNISSQVNKHNQIKSGIGVMFLNIKSRSAIFWLPQYQTVEEAPWTWQYWDENPVTGYFYIQDKLEFKGMIANIGLRADYQDPNTMAYQFSTPYDNFYTPQRFSVGVVQDLWFQSRRTESVKAEIKLQPRLGISFPVSDVGKIYFNYGHFYQIPDDYRMYSPAVTGGGAPGFLAPMPNVDWPRTIQYEASYEQQIADLFLVRVTGYYKDITGQFMYIQGRDWDETVNNHLWTNNEFADIRGVELTFSKPYGKFVSFWSNFNYSVSSAGVTSLDVIYENPFKAEEAKSFAPKLKPIPFISFNAGLRLFSPKDWGPDIFGAKIFSNMGANFVFRWNDGGEFIFNPQAPTENQHYIDVVDFSNTDLRLEKRIPIGSMQAVLFLDIRNLFNQKYLFTGAFTQSENQRYRNSLRLPWEKGDQKGNDKWGEFPNDGDKQHIDIGWRDWSQFLNPRNIYFGIRFNF
jgi:hypothetical protein